MPDKQTDKSRYPSRYSPDKFVTAAQYITELICEKLARRSGKELPIQFWQIKEWEKSFKNQITAARRLLSQYDERAIIKALNRKECKGVYSLRAPWLAGYIIEEQKKVEFADKMDKLKNEEKEESQTEINNNNISNQPSKQFINKNNIRNKLN